MQDSDNNFVTGASVAPEPSDTQVTPGQVPVEGRASFDSSPATPYLREPVAGDPAGLTASRRPASPFTGSSPSDIVRQSRAVGHDTQLMDFKTALRMADYWMKRADALNDYSFGLLDTGMPVSNGTMRALWALYDEIIIGNSVVIASLKNDPDYIITSLPSYDEVSARLALMDTKLAGRTGVPPGSVAASPVGAAAVYDVNILMGGKGPLSLSGQIRPNITPHLAQDDEPDFWDRFWLELYEMDWSDWFWAKFLAAFDLEDVVDLAQDMAEGGGVAKAVDKAAKALKKAMKNPGSKKAREKAANAVKKVAEKVAEKAEKQGKGAMAKKLLGAGAVAALGKIILECGKEIGSLMWDWALGNDLSENENFTRGKEK